MIVEERPAPGPSDASRYATPTGEPCPRTLRVDLTIEGSGDCCGCGCCLLFVGLLDGVTQRTPWPGGGNR